jgi:hypothetical protein
MCFGDSDLASNATDTYKGSVSFPALVSEPENSIVVSSDFGAPLEVSSFVIHSPPLPSFLTHHACRSWRLM